MATLDSVDLNATVTAVADSIIVDVLNAVTTKELRSYASTIIDTLEHVGHPVGDADEAAVFDILSDVFEQRVSALTER